MHTTAGTRAPAGAGRRRNARGEGQRLRLEILDAADALLAESRNASQLSLRGVAKKAGIAATSIYLHFPNVEHLKVALAERGFAELDEVRDRAGRGIADPDEVMLARARAYAAYALTHPGRYRLMFGPDLPPALAFGGDQSPSRHSFQALVDSIKQCQDAGRARRTPDAMRLAMDVWVSVHGLVTLRLDRPHFPWPPLDEMVNGIVGQLLGFSAVTAPPSGPRARTE